jgi:hypothetical protein
MHPKITEYFVTDPDPHLDPLVRSTDPRIRIRIRTGTKISRIRNIDFWHSLEFWFRKAAGIWIARRPTHMI